MTALIAAQPPASALDRPPSGEAWSMCSEEVADYCVELLQYTPTGGETLTYDDATYSTSHPFITVSDQRTEMTESHGLPSTLMWGIANPEFYDVYDGRSYPNMELNPGRPETIEGLPAGTYRTVLRIGDFDPTLFRTSGFMENYSIISRANDLWSVDVSMRPSVATGPGNVVPPAVGACDSSNWTQLGDFCETAVGAAKGALYGDFYQFGDEMTWPNIDKFNDFRGMWVATNAVAASIPIVNVSDRSIRVIMLGTHLLPADYGDCEEQGLTSDGDRCVTPAHYSAFIPFRLLAKLADMPVDIAKEYFSKDALSVQVEAKAVSDFAVDVDVNGITVDPNLKHYSQPNPKFTVKPPKSLKAGKTGDRSDYFTLPKNAKITDFSVGRQTTKKLCSVVDKGKSVAAAQGKTGYCVVTVKYKVGTSSKVLTKKTAIKIKK